MAVIKLSEIVKTIAHECAKETNTGMDELASNLILKAWSEEQEFESLSHVRAWTRCFIRCHMKWANGRANHKTFLFCELFRDKHSKDDHAALIDSLVRGIPARQESSAEVALMRKRVRNWPHIHRSIVLILGDGGSILDVSKDLGISPALALRYLEECRRFMATGNSIDAPAQAA